MPKYTRAQKRKLHRKLHRIMSWSRREETDKPPELYRTKNRGTRKRLGIGYQSNESSPRSASSASSTGSSVISILETIFPFAKSQTQARRLSSGRTSSGRRTRSSKSSASASSNSIWRTVSSVLGLDENKK